MYLNPLANGNRGAVRRVASLCFGARRPRGDAGLDCAAGGALGRGALGVLAHVQ